MGVTQYIGARYVPLFCGVWDINKEYEPLSIVYYEGNSYTSNQAVPAGTSLDEPAFWALTGNYNAQIEQYRQEVRAYDGRISANADAIAAERAAREIADESLQGRINDVDTSLNEAIGNESVERQNQDEALSIRISEVIEQVDKAVDYGAMKIRMFDGTNPDNFTLRLIHAAGANVVCDTGKAADNNAIIPWLKSQGCNHIDALVLTHFHGDHVDNMQGLISSELVDETTHVYIQMSPTTANDQYQTSYEVWLPALRDILNRYNYPAPIVPVHGEEITYGYGLKVTFYNTITDWAPIYDAGWANNGNWQERTTSMNDYSLITRCEYGGSVYVDTGDVEGEAQRLNAPYMQPCTVALNPHHFANKMGYEAFYNSLNPQYWLVANHFHNVEDDVERIDVYTWRLSYLYRFNTYNGLNRPVLTNISQPVEIDLDNGCIVKADGYLIDSSYNPSNRVINETYATMIPPSYYNGNPYFVYYDEFNIELLLNLWRQYNQALIPPAFYVPTVAGGSSYATTPIANALRALFAPIEPTAVLETSYNEYGHLVIGYSTVNSPYTEMGIITANGNTPGNTYWIPNRKGKVGNVITGTFSSGDALPENALALRMANIIEVTLDTGKIFGLMRQNGYPNENRNQAGIFEGFALTGSESSVKLYHVYISQGGTLTISLIDMANGTKDTTARTITKLRAVM